MPRTELNPTLEAPAVTGAASYAFQASPEFNARLHEAVSAIGRETALLLGADFEALILGGGYGRGEGGVVIRDGVELPYNDLDFTLIVKRRPCPAVARLQALSVRWAERLGIDVDFSRPITPADIRGWPNCLMWHDLLGGYRVVEGTRDVLSANAPVRMLEPLPAVEGLHLLLNRGAGLLWALRVLRGLDAAPDPDFVRRNHEKCALSLGDAVLIAHGRHATPYRGRVERLRALEAESAEVRALGLGELYARALEFKFRPDAVPPSGFDEEALRRLAESWGSVFVHVDGVMCGRSRGSLAECFVDPRPKETAEHTPVGIARNLARNLRMGRVSWRHPREALYRELPELLGLLGPCPAWPAKSERFLAVWRRYN